MVHLLRGGPAARRRAPGAAARRPAALTGYALPEDRLRAAEAGFARHLAKPLRMEELDEAIGAAGRPPVQPSSLVA